jgi:DNA end-binding protein Ku
MPRSIWTGSISFGLVNIPVRVFAAIRAHDVRFHQIAPDGSRIHYERVSEKSGKTVEYGDLKKGYETSKGKWVLFEHDELDKFSPPSTRLIEIEDFVDLDEIDPIYYERTYHLAPQDGASGAYALLAAAMFDRQRVGIGKVVMRDKQYLAAIRPYGRGLAMSTMLFADEVVPQSDVDGIPARKPSVGKREQQMATQIVDSLARDWDPKRYHDDYEEQVRALIRAKAKGKTLEAPDAEPTGQVLDLMEALRASLEGGRRKGRAPQERVNALLSSRPGRPRGAPRARPDGRAPGGGRRPSRRA